MSTGARIAAVAVALAGCDGVLHLERVSDRPRDASASDTSDSGTAEGLPPDDAANGCLPGMLSAIDAFAASSLNSAGIAPNMNVALVITSGGNIDYVNPIMTGTPTNTSIGGGAGVVDIAVQPTLIAGSSLFYVNSTTVFESQWIGPNFGSWGSALATDLPSGAAPGAPAEIGGGLRMVVAIAGHFEEYERSSGSSSWKQVLGSTLTFTDLGHPAGTLAYPALTPDGLDLVYVFSGSTGVAGIFFAHRDRLDLPWSKGNVISVGTYRSPVLMQDCLAVYAVDSTGRLVKIHN